MCGIAGQWSVVQGAYDSGAIEFNVKKMCKAIRHRGPDGNGLYRDESNPVVMGHQRLSIIDLEQGAQPMSDLAKRCWITYNGEIYNYLELREVLQRKGYPFRTRSDTECIIYAYLEWGEACVEKLNGMFAFAIWDKSKRKLFCARDRIGIKPFYYFWDQQQFVFCSELKGMLANPTINLGICDSAVIDYLRLGYTQGPKTAVDKIFKLSPGHTLSVQNGNLAKKTYWTVGTGQAGYSGLSFESASEALFNKLSGSVKGCLLGDVPVGAFLSGGVDSTGIVAMMANAGQHAFTTQCVGFKQQRLDEREYAREVANFFGTEHTESLVEFDVAREIEKVLWHLDEPNADASAIPTYFLCQETSTKVKVALSGDGGDELFAGYNWYQEIYQLTKFDAVVPAWLRHLVFKNLSMKFPYSYRGATLLKNLGEDSVHRHINLTGSLHDAEIEALFSRKGHYHCHPLSALYKRAPCHWDAIKTAQWVDLQSYLVEGILMKVDKMSMAHSLEVRVPILDHEVVEFTFQLPTRYKLMSGDRKRILKSCLKNSVPARMMNRKKQGFSVSLREWLLGDLKEYVGDFLLSGSTTPSGMFDVSQTNKLWQALLHPRGRIDLSQHIWSLLCFEIWLDLNKRAIHAR